LPRSLRCAADAPGGDAEEKIGHPGRDDGVRNLEGRKKVWVAGGDGYKLRAEFVAGVAMSGAGQKADYGLDAPGVVRNLFLAGIAAVALYALLPRATVGGITFILTPMFRNTAIGCFAGGVLMVLYSKYMKFGHR